MEYIVEEKEGFTVVGISTKTCNTDNQAMIDIPKLWGRFFGEGVKDKITNKVNEHFFGVYSNYEGDFEKPYTLTIGCNVSSSDSVPEGFVVTNVEKGKYAVFDVSGDLQKEIVNVWKYIWQADLERLYVTDFEEYVSETEAKIYVGIK